MASLKWSDENIKALKFDAPLVDSIPVPIVIRCEEYDFLNDWTLNTAEQPQGGIEVTEHTITIRKFKPNTWFIKSNYSIADAESYYDKFYNKNWNLSGVLENRDSLSGVTFHPFGDASQTYNAYGLVLSPCLPSGSLLSDGFPWDMNIPSGYFKGGVAGWNNFGYYDNGDWAMFNWKVYDAPWGEVYNQVGLAMFSSIEPDEDGFITLEATDDYVDPTTVEGFRACLGDAEVYDKPKTFKNVLMDYNLAAVDDFIPSDNCGNVFYTLSGGTDQNLTSDKSYYFLFSSAYTEDNGKLSIPFPTDLPQKIANNVPIKFGKKLGEGNFKSLIQYDRNENGFWNSLYNTMSETEITDCNWGESLFAGSNVPKMKLIFNPQYNAYSGSVYSLTDALAVNCFECTSSLKEAHLVKKGNNATLKDFNRMFRRCWSLTSLTMEVQDDNGDPANNRWEIYNMNGAFEMCGGLTAFPKTIKFVEGQNDGFEFSEPVCNLYYGFSLGGFKEIGDENDNYEVKVGLMRQAFEGGSIEKIYPVLDMGYVTASTWNGASAMFANTNVTDVKLKNLNHEDWHLDGTGIRVEPDNPVKDNIYIGDCSSFNQTSVEYLFNNLYDLTIDGSWGVKNTAPPFSGSNAWVATGTIVTGTTAFGTCADFTGAGQIAIAGDTIQGKYIKLTVEGLDDGDVQFVYDGNVVTASTDGNYPFAITGNSLTIKYTGSNSVRITNVSVWDSYADLRTSANLYCPSAWIDSAEGRSITTAMVNAANAKGWTVYVGGSVYNGS